MFDELYRAVIADTEQSRQIHYHLRYQVYCLEKKFEPLERFNGCMEIDEYDSRSVHFLIQHKPSGQWVGAARLIKSHPQSLPMIRLTGVPVTRQTLMMGRNVAELSRLSILRSFRRHGCRTHVNEPVVLLGLIRAAKEYSEANNIDYWIFLCRRAIMRIVGNLGMEMEIIGQPCEHRGLRYPYLATLATAFDGISERSPQVADMFSRKTMLQCYSELVGTSQHSIAA